MKTLFTKKKLQLPEVLDQPAIPSNISSNAKWLAGEGAGSWFAFDIIDVDQITVSRFSPQGIFECRETFDFPSVFNLEKEFSVTYPSYCSVVTVVQDGVKITLNKI